MTIASTTGIKNAPHPQLPDTSEEKVVTNELGKWHPFYRRANSCHCKILSWMRHLAWLDPLGDMVSMMQHKNEWPWHTLAARDCNTYLSPHKWKASKWTCFFTGNCSSWWIKSIFIPKRERGWCAHHFVGGCWKAQPGTLQNWHLYTLKHSCEVALEQK